MGASFKSNLVGDAGTTVWSGGSGAQGSGTAYGCGIADLLRYVEQLIAAPKKMENNIMKNLKNSVIFLVKVEIITSMNTIILVLWIQMHIVVAWNFLFDTIANIVFGFLKISNCKMF